MQYGISQAIAHRYTTPTIMAWCILYLMFFSKKNIQKNKSKIMQYYFNFYYCRHVSNST